MLPEKPNGIGRQVVPRLHGGDVAVCLDGDLPGFPPPLTMAARGVAFGAQDRGVP